MAKPEWGTKRICLSCGARFYDLQRDPIVCPSCETSFKAEDFQRTRRTRPVVEEPKPKPAPKKPAVVEEAEESEDEVALDEPALDESDSNDDSDVIEDTSDLGEDDDDVAEVMENVEDEDESDR